MHSNRRSSISSSENDDEERDLDRDRERFLALCSCGDTDRSLTAGALDGERDNLLNGERTGEVSLDDM